MLGHFFYIFLMLEYIANEKKYNIHVIHYELKGQYRWLKAMYRVFSFHLGERARSSHAAKSYTKVKLM